MPAGERMGSLLRAEAAGKTPKLLLFWGHRPNKDGSIGAGCLSQWWPAAFVVDGVRYPTAEHWMMAAKARLFEDDEALADVLAAPSPGAAKAAGRRVRRFDDAAWDAVRYDVVVRGSVAKFGRHPDLADFLRRTGSRVLVEASPVDRIWGIGRAADDPAAQRPSAWRGLNLLGFALMDAREQLAGPT